MSHSAHDRKSLFQLGMKAATASSFIVLFALTLRAQTYNVIHSFTRGGDGANPSTGVIADSVGNLYGTTLDGGGTGHFGTVFEVSQRDSHWTLTTLYAFTGSNQRDGASPSAALIRNSSGVLYGTTESGGNQNCYYEYYPGCGTVFELRPSPSRPNSALPPWIETQLYAFSGPDGDGPSSLAFSTSGNLFGVANSGGAYGHGAVFELTPSASGWTQQTIYSFTGGADGGNPVGVLAFDSQGNVFGTAILAGQYGFGTVFELSPSGSGWSETTLYSFGGFSVDGITPYAGLIVGPSGNLYGATMQSLNGNNGVVYQLSPGNRGWYYQAILTLPGAPGSYGPLANLTTDSEGNLYGTTYGNILAGVNGTVFELRWTHGSYEYTQLYQFSGGSDGGSPQSTVLVDTNGELFGTATDGGTEGYGVVWEITP